MKFSSLISYWGAMVAVVLTVLVLTTSCGPLSPTIKTKTDGGTEHNVNVNVDGEAEIRTVHKLEIDICEGITDEDKKSECITKVIDFLATQKETCSHLGKE